MVAWDQNGPLLLNLFPTIAGLSTDQNYVNALIEVGICFALGQCVVARCVVSEWLEPMRRCEWLRAKQFVFWLY